jgi:hypothetical protein
MYTDPSGHAEVQLRQLAVATGATITYDNTTKTATVTLVDGYSVKFKDNKDTIKIENGRMMIDNGLFNLMMSGKRTTQISQNSTTTTTRTTTATIDSAVAGNNVAVVTNVTQTTQETRRHSPGPPLKTQSVTLRDSTVVFNKETDMILNRYPVNEYPQFMHTRESNNSFSPAEKALIWEALTNENKSSGNVFTDAELQAFVDSRIFSKMSIAKTYRDIVELANNSYKNGVSLGELLGTSYLQQSAQIQQAIVLSTLKVGTQLPGAARSSGGCNCFTAGTKVLTDEGEKNIEDIEVGDRVLAKNEETGEQAYKEVTVLHRNEKDTTYKLSVGNQIIETTDNHPFWVDGKGWVLAVDLRVGDELVQSNGNHLKIDSIEIVHHDEKVKVYNFTVADFHTYFVSDLGIWVHINCLGSNYYLNEALKVKGFSSVPSTGMKAKFSQDGYDFEVRVHAADPRYGKTGDIYRVARRKQGTDANGQGYGWEYIDDKGMWHHTSTLNPKNPNFNEQAAADTHIQLP